MSCGLGGGTIDALMKQFDGGYSDSWSFKEFVSELKKKDYAAFLALDSRRQAQQQQDTEQQQQIERAAKGRPKTGRFGPTARGPGPPSLLSALRVSHRKSVFVWGFCTGAQGA